MLSNKLKQLLQDKPLVIFDIEPTGVKITKARIIHIAAIKVSLENDMIVSEVMDIMINPMQKIPSRKGNRPIKKEAFEKQMDFRKVAPNIRSFFQGCNLAGYNLLKFDLPLLAEEFARIGQVFPDEKEVEIIDVQTIFHTQEPRDLTAALRFYCDKKHDHAHDALSDARATWEVLQEQLKKYEDLPSTTSAFHDYSLRKKNLADWARVLYYDKENRLRFNNGKRKGELVTDHPRYAEWILRDEFPLSTKRILKNEIFRTLQEPKGPNKKG